MERTPLEWSIQMAESVIRRGEPNPNSWNYDFGLLMKGFEHLWKRTGDDKYYQLLKRNVDKLIDADGNIYNYPMEAYNLDFINASKLLFNLYKTTGDERYRKAIETSREQLRHQPRTSDGGFWHKKRYPYQMWLDGIYMSSPFYAEYAVTFGEPEALDDVARQIELVVLHHRDPKTGLFYHAWNETREEKWANPETGCSPHFWGRAVGWFAMALADLLELFPTDHPKRPFLAATLNDLAAALAKVQHPETGLWYQVLDQRERAGNYPEASASNMFVYALVKGVRLGAIDRARLETARKAHRGILEQMIEVEPDGMVNLHRIVLVSGLGGNPYRDGSYEYYVSEPVVTNDYKGVGPFILNGIEWDLLGEA